MLLAEHAFSTASIDATNTAFHLYRTKRNNVPLANMVGKFFQYLCSIGQLIARRKKCLTTTLISLFKLVPVPNVYLATFGQENRIYTNPIQRANAHHLEMLGCVRRYCYIYNKAVVH